MVRIVSCPSNLDLYGEPLNREYGELPTAKGGFNSKDANGGCNERWNEAPGCLNATWPKVALSVGSQNTKLDWRLSHVRAASRPLRRLTLRLSDLRRVTCREILALFERHSSSASTLSTEEQEN